ncbi:hypothetical protein Tco_0323441 [Tanacetum coccineum]
MFCTQEQRILISDIPLSEIICFKSGTLITFFIPLQYQLRVICSKHLDEQSFKRLDRCCELGMLNIDSKPEASALPE